MSGWARPCLLALAVSAGGAAAEAPPPVAFPPAPRVERTASELAGWKADPARSNEWAQAVRRADAILREPLVLPRKESQWIFYYACPKDGARLKPESLERHVCPSCKAAYTDDQTVAAYRTILNNRVDQGCRDLALAFAMTGDERYALPARSAMLDLAVLYPTFERHDRWGRRGLLAVVGGRRYCQLLDEAVSLIDLAKAYDWLAGSTSLSGADRVTITNYLASAAWEIHRFQGFTGNRNNHQTWFNAAYATVGLSIGDATLLNEAVHGGHGLLWQLENSVTEDGLWFEGTIAYQFYALQAIMQTLDVARRAGWDFAGNARLKSLWLGPIRMAYPNGQFPVFHDSDPASLAGYSRFYDWARRYFGDEVFAPYADAKRVASGAPPASAALTGIGVAVLRGGAGDRSVCAMVDYGIHGEGHGHPDKLNLVLYGLGREWLLDPGRISYSVPEYKTWCRTTVAHNTVVIDGRDQEPTTGELWFFSETNGYAAALCASEGAYPGCLLRRFVVLDGDLVVDAFSVTGRRKAHIDWVIHGRGALATNAPGERVDGPLGRSSGYQHLTGVRRLARAPAHEFRFDAGGGRSLGVVLAGAADSEVLQGVGIGYNQRDAVPFVMCRRTGLGALFVAVYDLSGDRLAARRVDLLPVQAGGEALPDTDAVAVRVSGDAGVRTYAVDLRRKADAPASLAGAVFERLGVRRGPD